MLEVNNLVTSLTTAIISKVKHFGVYDPYDKQYRLDVRGLRHKVVVEESSDMFGDKIYHTDTILEYIVCENDLYVLTDNCGCEISADSLFIDDLIKIYDELQKWKHINKFGRVWEIIDKLPSSTENWFVISNIDGKLYMNNLIGEMYFVEQDGGVLKCCL